MQMTWRFVRRLRNERREEILLCKEKKTMQRDESYGEKTVCFCRLLELSPTPSPLATRRR